MTTTASVNPFVDFLLPLSDQLDLLRHHNATTWGKRFSPELFKDVKLHTVHEQSIEDLEVLHVEGSTPGETLELLWAVIKKTHPNALRLDHVLGHRVSLCSNSRLTKNYRPGIHRVRLDLTRYWFRKGGVSPFAARRHAEMTGLKLAHGEVLSVFAWHSDLLQRMDGRIFPSMWLAGYDLRTNGKKVEVPGLLLHSEDQAPRLDSFELDSLSTFDAAPVLLES